MSNEDREPTGAALLKKYGIPIGKNGCLHPPVMNQSGQVMSPRTHYGDGSDGKTECVLCNTWWRTKEI